jgi:2-keto-4-pentenoate hydratase
MESDSSRDICCISSPNTGSSSPVAQERDAAQALWEAMVSKSRISPPRVLLDTPDLAAGYRVQALNVSRFVAEGQQKAGYKLALTSPAIQKQFGLNEPTSGVLFRSMVKGDNSTIEFSGLHQSRAEGEVAFEMAKGILDRSASVEDVLSAIGRARPAIEIVNCRIADWAVTSFDFVADNSAAEFVVLGESELEFRSRDLARVEMQLFEGGTVQARGRGDACMGNPITALHWLAMHLLQQGTPLEPGDIVMTGSLGPAVPLKSGDRIEMRLQGTEPVRLQLS